MIHDASISDCGRYRYSLKRYWDQTQPILGWILLNPSTADADRDDATIRVCSARAERMGCGAIEVRNLFAWRATDPRDLRRPIDPVGPNNDQAVESLIDLAGLKMVIAAWGNHGRYLDRDGAVASVLRRAGVPLLCLGVTKIGAPRHPLRIAYAVEPVPFEPPSDAPTHCRPAIGRSRKRRESV